MKIYSTFVFILAFVMVLPSLLLFYGETGWLHSFEKGRYTDKKTYSRLLGKTLLGIAFSLVISGMVSLIINVSIIVSIIILIGGIIVTMMIACKKAKKYY